MINILRFFYDKSQVPTFYGNYTSRSNNGKKNDIGIWLHHGKFFNHFHFTK